MGLLHAGHGTSDVEIHGGEDGHMVIYGLYECEEAPRARMAIELLTFMDAHVIYHWT